MRKSELYFEDIGDSFEAFMSAYDVSRRQALLQRFLDSVKPSGKALEVGCGTGALTPVLLNRGLSITVGDISKKLAETTAARLNVIGIECDAMQIQLPDRSQDLVMSSEVIEHVPDPAAALREMARVIAPGGYLAVTSPNRLWYPLLWIAQKSHLRKFSGNEIWLWPAAARRIISAAGLNIIQMSGCHLFPWQIPGAKKVLPLFDAYGTQLWPFMINWGILAQRPVGDSKVAEL
jgi:ubiquinone/menaquinone biosynthesis C-methylase UbiE